MFLINVCHVQVTLMFSHLLHDNNVFGFTVSVSLSEIMDVMRLCRVARQAIDRKSDELWASGFFKHVGDAFCDKRGRRDWVIKHVSIAPSL